MHLRGHVLALLLAALFAIYGRDVGAQTRPASGAIGPANFNAFADDQIGRAISRGDWPGAAIVFVKNGQIVFARGYGVADLQTHAAVDPLVTGFRVGSISKLFTNVAMLQLVEKGKLSLQDPIQSHLPDIALGNAGDGVTIHNLLTHTDGFDVGWSVGGAVRDERDAISLGQFLQSRPPRRILPPGQMYVYSDVGMALAGHIVENVDGRPFAQYARDEIFSPLGMSRSTFFQPLPAPIAQSMATGYRKFAGRLTPMPFEHVLAVPSAAMTTTAGDMARFMIAVMNHGQIDGRRVLKPDTTSLMLDRQFSHNPALPGAAYGFYEHLENGQRALQHGGVMPGYHSLMLLLPEHQFGVFIVTNAYGDESFDPLIHAFFNRFFPPPATQPSVDVRPEVRSAPSNDLSGRYRYVQYPHGDIGKLSVLVGMVEERHIREQPDGSLIVDRGLQGAWRATGPLLYSRGEEKLAFRQDDRGRTIGMVYDTWAFEKIHWYEARRAQIALLALMSALFILSPMATLISRLRLRGQTPANPPRDLAALACLFNLAMLLTLSYSIWRIDAFMWYYGLPKYIAILRYAPWLSIAITAASIVMTMRAITSPRWTILSKIIHLTALAALCAFPLFCWYWNLLALPG